jgi:hypothetical protein
LVTQDPDYAPRLAGFTAYKASIYARYPPVCDTCAPLVEEEIRKKDVMARSNALGSWLNESKKKDTRRQVCLSNMDRHKLNRELRWWTARGVLWTATVLGSVSVDVAGAYIGRSILGSSLTDQSPVVRRYGPFGTTYGEELPHSITSDFRLLVYTLDSLVTHLCIISKSRASGQKSTCAR